TASSGSEALDDIRRYRPDIVTVDLLLPDVTGEDLVRRILAEFPGTQIVAVTSVLDHMNTRRALDAGGRGYVSKAAAARELIQAIREVHAGRSVIPGPIPCDSAGSRAEQPLTIRDTQVLQLVAWGKSPRQIAAHLCTSIKTLRIQMRDIIGKLGASNTTHA